MFIYEWVFGVNPNEQARKSCKPAIQWTPELERRCTQLVLRYGTNAKAMEQINCSNRVFYNRLKKSPEFARAIEDAKDPSRAREFDDAKIVTVARDRLLSTGVGFRASILTFNE